MLVCNNTCFYKCIIIGNVCLYSTMIVLQVIIVSFNYNLDKQMSCTRNVIIWTMLFDKQN